MSNLYPSVFLSSASSGFTKSCIPLNKISEPLSDDYVINHPLWFKAMTKEIEAIQLKDIWYMIPPTPVMNPIDCKWVYRVKLNADDTLDKLKARLVANGFQQLVGFDFLENFSHVVKSFSARLLFSLVPLIKGIFNI